jgi:hypothetical protein
VITQIVISSLANANVFGPRGFREFQVMQDFQRWVAEILETIADRLQPRDFDELVAHELTDLDPS